MTTIQKHDRHTAKIKASAYYSASCAYDQGRSAPHLIPRSMPASFYDSERWGLEEDLGRAPTDREMRIYEQAWNERMDELLAHKA